MLYPTVVVMSTYADIAEWAADKLCQDNAKFFCGMESASYQPDTDLIEFAATTFEYQNDLLILDCFNVRGGDEEDAIGFVCTSRKLFRNIPAALRAQSESGVLGVTDGTYKIHFGGWTLLSFGTATLFFKARKFQHSFVPWAFMFVRSESTASYTAMFSSVVLRCEQFFEMPLVISFGSLDRATPIAKAFRQQWPEIKLLSCWPHLIRNATKRAKLEKVDMLFGELIEPHLHILHKCRSPEQHAAFLPKILAHWRGVGASSYADWFTAEYGVDPWLSWFCTSSGVSGVVPNQNCIEAFNKVLKKAAGVTLRAASSVVLGDTLPRFAVLSADPNLYTGGLYHFCAGPLSADATVKARCLVNPRNHKRVYATQRSPRVLLSIVFNASTYLLDGDNLEGIAVTAARVKQYKCGKADSISFESTVANFPLFYQSLYEVTIHTTEQILHSTSSPTWSIDEIMRNCDGYRFAVAYSAHSLSSGAIHSCQVLVRLSKVFRDGMAVRPRNRGACPR
jgi:hypothetical protein